MHKEDKKSKMLISEANKQIEYMSNTIDGFRDFYNPSKAKEEFSIKEASQNALQIVSHSLKASNIEVIENFEEESFVYGNRNEFEQVILNLINNAKDAFLEREIISPIIEITLQNKVLSIRDNGGGISKDNIRKIFNPYFSTKKDSDGIGLYISKMIIEQELGGVLKVQSDSKGTTFTIIL